MKQDEPISCILTLILLAFIFVGIAVEDCGKPARLGIDKLIAVEDFHATRYLIIFKDKNGCFYSESIHHSHTYSDGEFTVGMSTPRGVLPGREELYEQYLATKQ